MTENKAKIKKRLEGTVVSDKMTKTVVVLVERMKMAPKYKKYHKVSTRFKAHSEIGQCRTGDRVVIEESRPLSREKKWVVVKVLQKESKKSDRVNAGEAEGNAGGNQQI
ncbi:MAG: 30S ribosomal protein S17 [Patescibacteria group bacterium]|nr:30S ribosomal protein S17 [Patescibacteria group bacterium]